MSQIKYLDNSSISEDADSIVYRAVVKHEIDGVATAIRDTDDNKLVIECSKRLNLFSDSAPF